MANMFKRPNFIIKKSKINGKIQIEKIFHPTNAELAHFYLENKTSKDFNALLDFFIQQKININLLQDEFGDSLIHLAINQKTTQKLKVLMLYKINLDNINLDNLTALELCLFSNQKKINHIKELLSNGAQLSEHSHALYHIAKFDDKHTILKLIYKYAKNCYSQNLIYDITEDACFSTSVIEYAYKNNARKNYNYLLKFTEQYKEKNRLLKFIKEKPKKIIKKI